MTSEKRIVANRQNALASTGPKTEKGKQVLSKNAVTHGLLSQEVVVHGETLTAFDELRMGLCEDFDPCGAMESLLVEKIANYAWRLRRAVNAEALMMQTGLSSTYCPKTLDAFFEGSASKKMNNISRYEAMLSKHFYRALRELRDLQSMRRLDAQKQADKALWGIGFVSSN